ncbi:23S rRNA pseudouridine(1911/1915/1917) synthase RluD [Candidatus Curculioniphilus buchneri]|uniref:23S rRNA pseudouridine(1911/1915/1917) synthase RluD n=1 Tax=Candidatus Curculioniphilus buchneri TaxID=690594 RepID=UPI00376F239B
MELHKYFDKIVDESQFGKRLDQIITDWFPCYSRSQIQSWILDGLVKVNGIVIAKPKQKILNRVLVEIQATFKKQRHWEAQDIHLNIIYEDDDILIINKPRNLLVHPGVGNPNGTMLNALLHYFPPISAVPRAGIVHRLDKDTTGLMIVAKTIKAHIGLVYSILTKAILRKYEAIATGAIISGGTIEQPIARHTTKRKKMTVHPMGKPAVTHYRILERYRNHTRLNVWLETGRTHQIRVHIRYINHPLVGDPLYGGCVRPIKGASEIFNDILRRFDRQALHANFLRFHHPISNNEMEWCIPLPKDMIELVRVLQDDTKQYQNK